MSNRIDPWHGIVKLVRELHHIHSLVITDNEISLVTKSAQAIETLHKTTLGQSRIGFRLIPLEYGDYQIKIWRIE